MRPRSRRPRTESREGGSPGLDRWASEHHNPERLERLHRNVLVSERHLALPMEAYDELSTWGQANDAWIRVAQEVGAEAIEDALRRANLDRQRTVRR